MSGGHDLNRAFTTGALCAATLILSCQEAASPPVRELSPDLLLITVDTLRADRARAVSTPVLDALAARGVRFAEATTPLPRTTPALASLLTGLAPQHHGSREVGQPLGRGRTLAQLLATRGYATVGVVANPLSGHRQRLDAGFDNFTERAQMRSDRADAVVDLALARVKSAPTGKPLFLWVHLMDPHFFYEAPEPPASSGSPGATDEARKIAGCQKLIEQVKQKKIASGKVYADVGRVASRVVAGCRVLYDREIAYADGQIGRLLRGLEARGRLSQTVVVFTSDHGENLGEGGLYYEHGPSVHDAALRVPLVLAGPGVPAGRRDRGRARLVDVLPTVLSVLGMSSAAPVGLDGVDLMPRLRGVAGKLGAAGALGVRGKPGAPGAQPLAFAESASALHVHLSSSLYSGRASEHHCFNGPRFSLCQKGARPWTLHDRGRDPRLQRDVSAEFPEDRARLFAATEAWDLEEVRERTVRDGRFKLVAYPLLAGGYHHALYDLKSLDGERRDVSAEHPVDRARLLAALEAWGRGLPGKRKTASGAVASPDAETVEDLRALGYVQ